MSIVYSHHLLWEGSQRDSEYQPPKVRGIEPKTQQRADPRQEEKLLLKWQAKHMKQDDLQVMVAEKEE